MSRSCEAPAVVAVERTNMVRNHVPGRNSSRNRPSPTRLSSPIRNATEGTQWHFGAHLMKKLYHGAASALDGLLFDGMTICAGGFGLSAYRSG